MRKLFIPFVLSVFVIFGLGLLFSQQNQEEEKFQKTIDTYFDDLWKFYPTAGTLAGYYKYNDKLEDFSSKNLEKRHDELDGLNQELVAKVDKTKIGQESMIDYEIIIDSMDLEVMRHENLLPWEYNPVSYNEIFYQSIKSLLVKDFAPLDARLKSATQRAKQLPSFIKQAKENLKTPPQVFTETAIAQFSGILDFYRNEVPKLTEQASADVKSAFQAEVAKVIVALEDYQIFLKSQLLPKSTGNFRLGEQAHLRLLRLTSENSIPFEELLARAKADYNNIRREMALVAMPFYRIMYPSINMEQLSTQYNDEQLRNIFIKGVFDKIETEHPAKEIFIDQAKTDVDFVKNFLTQAQLVQLPDAGLTIEPIPLAERGVALTRLIAPGAYETGGAYAAQVSPVPAAWSAEQADSFLEEYNNFYIYFWVVRNIYPGQFAPLYFTQKYPSLARKAFPNMPLVKGWPLYVENVLIYSGFGNYDLRLRINQLKSQLKIVIDFQLEINIHQGGMTKEQAIQYMTGGGFQTQAEAERKWNSILLSPGDAAYPYIGIQEIWDMEKDYKKLKGDAYNQKEFLQKLLSYGALPIRRLKSLMAQ
jgi:uncharacterized protein (DUF885 family)